jgi:predicted amidohydrolase YtcJ
MRDFWEAKLGAQRAQRIHPYKQFLSDGILLGGGSDSPVTPIDPITGIHAAVNHLVPSHSLSVDEALRLFTIEAAKLAFQENTIGSLQPGKLADIVVLSENPLEVQPARLKDIRVEATIKGGQITYKSPKISVEHIR